MSSRYLSRVGAHGAAMAEMADTEKDSTARLTELLADHSAMGGLHNALQRQNAADAVNFMMVLQRQEVFCAAAVEEAKYTVEQKITERVLEEQRAMRELNTAQLKDLSEEHAKHVREAVRNAELTALAHLEEVVAVERAAAREMEQQAQLGERQAYLDTLKQLDVDVDVLARVLSHDSRYKRTSHAVLQMAAATRSLDRPSRGVHDGVLTSVVGRLEDELMTELALTASATSTQAVATLKELQGRFVRVQNAGEQAILVPEGGGMWGHALAALITTAMGAAKVPPRSMNHRFEASGVIASAADWMEQGDLLEAVREVRRLKGQPAAACAGWRESAEHRLLQDQVRTAMQAEIDIALGAMC